MKRLYSYVRAVTKYYASRRLTYHFSCILGRIFPVKEPVWAVGEPHGLAPRLELNLQCPHQRRAFLFPRGYFNYRMKQPFSRFAEQALEPGALFVDIGAHFGLFTLHAARLVGVKGRVISFEPNPEMYASLSRSAQLSTAGTITCADVALSDVTGETLFYQARKPPSSSLVPKPKLGGIATQVRSW